MNAEVREKGLSRRRSSNDWNVIDVSSSLPVNSGQKSYTFISSTFEGKETAWELTPSLWNVR